MPWLQMTNVVLFKSLFWKAWCHKREGFKKKSVEFYNFWIWLFRKHLLNSLIQSKCMHMTLWQYFENSKITNFMTKMAVTFFLSFCNTLYIKDTGGGGEDSIFLELHTKWEVLHLIFLAPLGKLYLSADCII